MQTIKERRLKILVALDEVERKAMAASDRGQKLKFKGETRVDDGLSYRDALASELLAFAQDSGQVARASIEALKGIDLEAGNFADSELARLAAAPTPELEDRLAGLPYFREALDGALAELARGVVAAANLEANYKAVAAGSPDEICAQICRVFCPLMGGALNLRRAGIFYSRRASESEIFSLHCVLGRFDKPKAQG